MIASVVQMFKTAIKITVVAVVVGFALVLGQEAISHLPGLADQRPTQLLDQWWHLDQWWRAIWPPSDGSPHRVLQVVALAWIACLGWTMLSHGPRTLFNFRRKDDYR